jgi:hypothetical protein
MGTTNCCLLWPVLPCGPKKLITHLVSSTRSENLNTPAALPCDYNI